MLRHHQLLITNATELIAPSGDRCAVHDIDDARVGVCLNYLCAAILAYIAYDLSHTHIDCARTRFAVRAEVYMSIAYFFGALIRSVSITHVIGGAVECVAWAFYPFFVCSYGALLASCNASLQVVAPSATRVASMLRFAFRVPLLCIVGGAAVCQFGAKVVVEGREAALTTSKTCISSRASCHRFMILGEGVAYGAWLATAVYAAMRVYPHCQIHEEKWATMLWPLALAFGPGQILAVSILPVADGLLHGETLQQGQHHALLWYCRLHTGVTYLVASLLSHVCSVYVVGRLLLHRRTTYYPVNV